MTAPSTSKPVPLGQDFDGSLLLPAADARIHGEQIRYESGDNRDNIGFWFNPDEWVDWQFKVTKAGKFEISADVAGTDSASFEVSLGDQKAKATAKATGDYGKFRVTKIGAMEISAPGVVTFSFRPVKEGWHPINLKSVRFKPAD